MKYLLALFLALFISLPAAAVDGGSTWVGLGKVTTKAAVHAFLTSSDFGPDRCPHGSPLLGHEQTIVDASRRTKVRVGLAFGVWMRESQAWCGHGHEGQFNMGDMIAPYHDAQAPACNACSPRGTCRQGRITWRCFQDMDTAINAWFDHAASYGPRITILAALRKYAPPADHQLYLSIVLHYISVLGGK